MALGCDKSDAQFSHITPFEMMSKRFFFSVFFFVAAHLLIFHNLSHTHTYTHLPCSIFSATLHQQLEEKRSDHNVDFTGRHHPSNLYPFWLSQVRNWQGNKFGRGKGLNPSAAISTYGCREWWKVKQQRAILPWWGVEWVGVHVGFGGGGCR